MSLPSAVYAPEVWSTRSIMHLHDTLWLARLVRRDWSNEIAQFGDTIHTRKRAALTARTWAGQTLTAGIATNKITVELLSATDISILLDTLKYTAYLLEDKDKAISLVDLDQEYLIPAVQPLSQAIDDSLFTEFTTGTDVDGATVSAGGDDTTDNGAAMNEDDIVWARKTLETAQCPRPGRVLVLSTEHEYDLLKTDLFQQVSTAGTNRAQVEGFLDRKFGFDIYSSQNIADYTGVPTVGNIPQSIAFIPDVMALVTRNLPAPGPGAVGATAAMDGVSIRVTQQYDTEYKGTIVSFDVLYGVSLLENALGVIVRP